MPLIDREKRRAYQREWNRKNGAKSSRRYYLSHTITRRQEGLLQQRMRRAAVGQLVEWFKIDRVWTVTAAFLLSAWTLIIATQMISVSVLESVLASRWLYGLLKLPSVTLFAQTAIASDHGSVAI